MHESYEILDELREGYQSLVERQGLRDYEIMPSYTEEPLIGLKWRSEGFERVIIGSDSDNWDLAYLDGAVHKSAPTGAKLEKEIPLGLVNMNNIDVQLDFLYGTLESINEEDMKVYAAGI